MALCRARKEEQESTVFRTVEEREQRMLFMTGAWNILYNIVGKKDIFYFIQINVKLVSKNIT
jgi:hypothetical protein